MWDKLHKTRLWQRWHKKSGFDRELTYASHHHMLPLYALSATAITGVLVVGCFVTVLWQNNQTEALKPVINTAVQAVDSQYLPTTINPTEKKQYIYPANIRFAALDPYNLLRYNYDPGIAGTPTSATLLITTQNDLKNLESAALANPKDSNALLDKLQQCKSLYAIRFVPGVTPFGGFAPLQEVKLKDGRTAYIHKNSQCVPTSTEDMNALDNIETAVLSIESY